MSKAEIIQLSTAPVETDLPEGWISASIGELCSVQKEKGREGVVPYLEIGNVDIKLKEYGLTDKPSVKGCKLANKNDVLVSRVRPTRGAITWIKEEEIEVSSAFTVLRNPGGLAEKYLWLYLAFNEEYLNYLGDHCTGTMYPTTSDKVVTGYEVPLAPLAEQKRIVTKAAALLEGLSAARDKIARVSIILKRVRHSVLAAACSGQLTAEWRARNDTEPADKLLSTLHARKRKALGKKFREQACPEAEEEFELPEGWAFAGIDSLLSVERRGMKTGPFGTALKKSEHQAEGVPVLGIENIGPMRFEHGSKIHITPEKASALAEYDAQPGDVLISRSGTVGEVCVVPEGLGEARISTNIMRVCLAKDSMLPQLFCFMFNGSPFVLSQVARLCGGSTRDFLNQKILRSICFALPPLEEQREIVRRVEALLALADGIDAHVRAATIRAERLPQAILARAFRGELVPTEADLAAKEGREYETAEQLLARIRAENAKREMQKKSRPRKTARKKTAMKKMDKDRVLEVIKAMPRKTFSFDELRTKLPGEYNDLKEILFTQLDDSKSGIDQVFDKKAKAIRFRRRAKP